MAFDLNNFNVSEDEYKQGLYGSDALTEAAPVGGAINTQLLSSIMKSFSGLTMMSEGIDMISDGANLSAGIYRSSGKAAVQGANFKASVYRQAGQAAVTSANYNIALDEMQTQRQQDALGRQLTDVLSSNSAIAASSGISMSSKSSMMVNNDILSTAERQFVQQRNDANQRQSLLTYQGQLAKMSYENQARAAQYEGQVAAQAAENQARNAEYQGEVAVYQAKQKRSDMIGGAITDAFKSFGGI